MKAANRGSFNFARPIDSFVGLVICAGLFAWSRLTRRNGPGALPPLRATTPPRDSDLPRPARRILCIKFYGLGNIVMLLPVLNAIRRAWPESEIDFLTLAENVTLLERSGLVDRAIAVRASDPIGFVQSFAGAFREIRTRGYDAVFDFEQFIKLSSIIGFVSGAQRCIGFNTDGQRRAWLYTTRVVYTDGDHMSRIFMRILHAAGIPGEPLPLQLQTAVEERNRIEELLRTENTVNGSGPLVVVHVGSGPNFYRVALKRWPIENFARLCDELVARHGARILLTGKGDEERELVDATRQQMKSPVIDLCDRLSVAELMALLQRCDLVVVNDTSVMHLASALGTSVAAFFGPTAPFQYGPGKGNHVVFYRDLYCSPCITNYNLKVSRCVDPVCVRSITVDEVLAAVEPLLSRSSSFKSRPQGLPSESAEVGA